MPASVAALWAEVDKGFRPVLGTTFPLEQAARAHHMLEDDQNLGRVVLLVDHNGPVGGTTCGDAGPAAR